jgi:hypothetical protein
MRSLRAGFLLALAITALAVVPAGAQAAFGFVPGPTGFSGGVYADGAGTPDLQAGTHPYSMVWEFHLNQAGGYPQGDLRELHVDLPSGIVENPGTVSQCTAEEFDTARQSPYENSLSGESCAGLSQIGVVTVEGAYEGGETRSFGLFSLRPTLGRPSRVGFAPWGIPVTLSPHVRSTEGDYGLTLDLQNFSQQVGVTGMRFEVWGVPWASSHDGRRGNCLNEADPAAPHAGCPSAALNPQHANQAYLTNPTSCQGPLAFHALATSWQGASAEASAATSQPLGGCQNLIYNPIPSAGLSTERVNTPTGFDYSIEGNVEGLINPVTPAHSQAKSSVLTLPEGMTINPSMAAGLTTCSEAQFASETAFTPAGSGCPNSSKIGEMTIQSPLAEGTIQGSMYVATPFDNRFGSLLTLFLIGKSPTRGLIVKIAGKAVPDPATGHVIVTFDGLPQLPYSNIDIKFRAGQRSPLVSPPACGSYATQIDTTAWRSPTEVVSQISPFSLTAGIGAGPCPSGQAPFTPGASGGSLNANASSYSPFYLHLTRTDGEQEITSYSVSLPPGLLASIAGIPFCSEAQIDAARHQSGAESASSPACPAASRIGRTYTGYGVGSALAYAPGGLYLAGPYHGAPLSVVAIDSAKVGPFDLGTVVIRSAVDIDRGTAQVSLDSAGSDPIPHILGGVPLRLRDIRIYLDRPNFMVNPTSCNPFSVISALTGSGARFSDPSDDSHASATAPFQVSNCSALGFAPRFKLALTGTKHGDYPALTATVTPRPGDANIGAAVVNMPSRIFLAQEHLRNVCTLKQFAAHACPKTSVYGTATAVTPLLGEPLTGTVYLRSNGAQRPLPDLVAALSWHGIEVDVLGKIDSHKGGLRATFEGLPDAGVTKFTMHLLGGKRGILQNATDLCTDPQVAQARFVGQDNGVESLNVPLQVKCKGGKKGGKGKGAGKGSKGGKKS